MFVLVVGGGKVGYYLTRELLESGHEVVLMEKDRARASQIADEIGSIVVAQDGCEGKYLGEAGCNRADIVAAVNGWLMSTDEPEIVRRRSFLHSGLLLSGVFDCRHLGLGLPGQTAREVTFVRVEPVIGLAGEPGEKPGIRSVKTVLLAPVRCEGRSEGG